MSPRYVRHIKYNEIKFTLVVLFLLIGIISIWGFASEASNPIDAIPILSNDHKSENQEQSNFTILNTGVGGNEFEHSMHSWNRVKIDNSGDILVYGIALEIKQGVRNYDIFLLKMDSNGKIKWSIRYGGSRSEYLGTNPILIDSENNIIVYGETISSDLSLKNQKFPYSPYGIQNRTSFILKYDYSGKLLIATYYETKILEMILDQQDDLWIIDEQDNFTKIRLFSNNLDIRQVIDISSSNIEIPYSHIDYNDIDEPDGDTLLIDNNNNLYLVGIVSSGGLITENAFRSDPIAQKEFFLLKASGSGIAYSTYLGINGDWRIDSLFIDSSNNIFVVFDNTNKTYIHSDPQTEFVDGSLIKEILKFNPQGSLLWNTTVELPNLLYGALSCSYLSSTGNINFALLTPNHFDVNNSLTRQGNLGIFSLDLDGSVLWNYTIQNQLSWKWRSQYSFRILNDNLNNLYVSSGFFEEPYIDDLAFNLYKFTPFGEVAWDYHSRNSEVNTTDPRFILSNDNKIIIVSHINQVTTGDVNIVKVSPIGDVIFNFTYGGSAHDVVFDFSLNEDNTLYLLGATTSSDLQLLNGFDENYAELGTFPAAIGFVLIIDDSGNEIMSSYIVQDPLLYNPNKTLVNRRIFLLIAIFSIATSLGLAYNIRILSRVRATELWDSNDVLSIFSRIFSSNQRVAYLFWGISQDNGSTKKIQEDFPSAIIAFKYLFHPVRLSILKLLIDNISLSTIEIRSTLDLSWNVLNPHLTSLEENGYITTEADFEDAKLRKLVQINPSGINKFNEFKILMIDFLRNPESELIVAQAEDLDVNISQSHNNLYPER